MFDVTFKDVYEADSRIRPVVEKTPLVYSAGLSEMTGADVYLKLENLLQPVGSFKMRGALNRIATLDDAQKEKGILAVSAGNHSQAVAFCGRLFGIDTAIFMPENSPSVKVDRTRAFGAEVFLHGSDYDDSARQAEEYRRETGRTFIHPFCDGMIIAGQGTVGFEIMRERPEIDVMVAPVGGGGLICGCSIAAKTSRPEVEIFGVQPEASAPFYHCMKEGRYIETPIGDSIADALTGEIISEDFFEFFRKHVDEMAYVREEEIEHAIYWMLMNHAQLVEGGGAAGVAALIEKKSDFSGRKVAVIVTGCGIDASRLGRIIEKFEGGGYTTA